MVGARRSGQNAYCNGCVATAGGTLHPFLMRDSGDMQIQDPIEIAHRLTELRVEHRDLDAAIERLATTISRDELQLTRLKKRKLQLKDTITRLESRMIPDLDA
jgi:hypothetical protein